MSRSGGLSEARPSVFKSSRKLGTHLSTPCSRDQRLSRPYPYLWSPDVELAKFKWEQLEYLSYSSDMSPCDFYMFDPQKKHLKEALHLGRQTQGRC
ncbi:hypothetical protein TNCV_4424291 [Trichonephila clavipes]|nr:hypothetical protein TNCV_4424291 [Trichonephila clavipes]